VAGNSLFKRLRYASQIPANGSGTPRFYGSYENRSDRPRRAMLVNVFREGERSANDESCLPAYQRFRRGEDGRAVLLLLFDPGCNGELKKGQ